MENDGAMCPNCDKKNTVKRGFINTAVGGKKQRFYCKDCKKKFVPRTAFYRMRNNAQKITCALDLFYKGLSTREVQDHFKAFFPHNSDHSTILRWIRKYSMKIADYTDNLEVQTGSYIEVDEMQYRRRASHKKKGTDENWFIDSIDVKTRFMLGSAYAKERSKQEIGKVLLGVKRKSGDQIKTVVTDGLMAYENVVKHTFGYNNRLQRYNVIHRMVNASKGEGFNIWVERMHNTIRQRTRKFRGLHGSVESAYAIMKGMEIYYNFIRKHEALKYKTPSELAIPSLEFKTANRWLELIERSYLK
ncbi:DDE domain protein [uncultured archaeon]|nr:DDE domain protein [uncultured archaeon]